MSFTNLAGTTTDAQIPDNITVNAAGTATTLAANPADCATGQFANAIASNGDLTCTTASGGVGGSGTAGIIAKFTGPASIGDSTITENGGNVGIGTTTPTHRLDVEGSARINGIVVDIGEDSTIPSPGQAVIFVNSNNTLILGNLGIEPHQGIALYAKANDFTSAGYMYIAGGSKLIQFGTAQHHGKYEFYGDVQLVYDTSDLMVGGSLQVFGVKSFVQPHPTDPTKEIHYVSLEGGEAGTYARGSGRLTNGEAVVLLPDHFAQVTSPEGLTI